MGTDRGQWSLGYSERSKGGWHILRSTTTRRWHGYYWARRTQQGDYEIRSVPSSLGEHSVPGGVMPKEGFVEHYEKVDP